MGSKYRNKFFLAKRPWSVYKDMVLDYYLDPYLQKVKKIGKPITIIDMFAGRGEFETGEQGSPLIIAKHLRTLADQGFPVNLRCYENYKPFFNHLSRALQPISFAEAVPDDCFAHVEDLAQRAASHTTLLYIDPCDVTQLVLSKLAMVYENVRQKSSVEAIVVFMASAFMREAARSRSIEIKLEDTGAMQDSLIRDAEEDDKAMWLSALYGDEASWYAESRRAESLLTAVAGGDYWKAIIDDSSIEWKEKCETFVAEYKRRLKKWFNVAESFPIHADDSRIPKYWIVFVSRYEPAFDLFNRAACDVTRQQRQNFRQPGTLFEGTERQPESAVPATVDREVKRAARRIGPSQWQQLRWRTCGDRNVGKFTDAEVNQGIKRLLKTGWLAGASGDKIQEQALLSPTPALAAWVDN